jgi:hypothetical protein
VQEISRSLDDAADQQQAPSLPFRYSVAIPERKKGKIIQSQNQPNLYSKPLYIIVSIALKPTRNLYMKEIVKL